MMNENTTTNSEMNLAFYRWICYVNEIEDKRDRGEFRDTHTGEQIPKRYLNEQYAVPTAKMVQYLEQCFEFLEQDLRDWLEMVIEGEMLFSDQLFGRGIYEGSGLMDLRFSLSNDLFVSDALANKKRNRKLIMTELGKRAR